MSEGPNGIQDSRPCGAGPDQSEGTGADGPQGDPYSWYQRGLELLSGGSPAAAAQILERYLEAADNFRLIVEASPADDYAHFGLGLSLARSGDPASAAEYLALAAAMRPDVKHYTTALHQVRATLHSRTGDGRSGPSRPNGGPTGDKEDD